MSSLKSRIPTPLYRLYRSSQEQFTLIKRISHIDFSKLKSPFFMVILPGSMHIARLALKYIPEDQDIVLIFNGCEKWEEEWAYTNLHFTGSISLNTSLPHATIINFLFRSIQQPFGLIDNDCFVFDPLFFTKIKEISENTSFSSYYGFTTKNLTAIVPETFFLFVNPTVLIPIMKKYHMDATGKTWNDLSDTVKKRILELGLNQDCYLRNYPKIFDTFHILYLLCLAEQKEFHFPELLSKFESTKIFHVGGISFIKKTGLPWGIRNRGTYFWKKALKQEPDKLLASRYKNHFGVESSDEEIEELRRMEEEDQDFVKAVNRVISEGTR